MYRGKGNTKGYPEWRRAKPKPEKLARDITASIKAHRGNGVERVSEMYTTNSETLREAI
jgi:hypothetical protein